MDSNPGLRAQKIVKLCQTKTVGATRLTIECKASQKTTNKNMQHILLLSQLPMLASRHGVMEEAVGVIERQPLVDPADGRDPTRPHGRVWQCADVIHAIS